MSNTPCTSKPNKTDAGNGSNGIPELNLQCNMGFISLVSKQFGNEKRTRKNGRGKTGDLGVTIL